MKELREGALQRSRGRASPVEKKACAKVLGGVCLLCLRDNIRGSAAGAE